EWRQRIRVAARLKLLRESGGRQRIRSGGATATWHSGGVATVPGGNRKSGFNFQTGEIPCPTPNLRNGETTAPKINSIHRAALNCANTRRRSSLRQSQTALSSP